MSRIVILTDSLGAHSGGLAHATLNLAASTSSSLPDHELRVVAQLDHSELDIGQDLPANLSICKYSGLRNSIFPYSSQALKTLTHQTPDLLHLRGLWRQSSLIAMKWKKATNKPLIVQTAGMLEPWARRRNALLKRIYYKCIESKVLRRADRIHATSITEKETLVNLGFPDQKIFILEEGVQVPACPIVSTYRKSTNSKPNVLLFLARLHPVKGIEILLEALSLLRPRDWHCKIAGMGEPRYVLHLHQLVQTYGLGDVVSFCGPLNGALKEKAFAEASAFILPSYTESFGIAIAEAMAWSLPVITTSETPWSIINDRNMGWVVPPSTSSISEAIFQLIQTPSEELHAMGLRGHNYVKERYDWNHLGVRMAKIYSALLK